MASADVLLVTVGEYPGSDNKLPRLPGAAEDGKRVSNWLKQSAPDLDVTAFSWPLPLPVTPSPAPPPAPVWGCNAVEDSCKKFLMQSKSGMRDRLFVYFAGHGKLNADRTLVPFLYCAQHSMRYPDLFPTSSWVSLLTAEKAYKEYLFFLDCCNTDTYDPPPQIFAPSISPRSDHPGVLLVTAAQPAQKAVENDQGGAFTRVLLEALSGSAGSPDSPDVTAADVVNYLKVFVPKRAKEINPAATQTPVEWFDPYMHADLKTFVIFKRDMVSGVDITHLLEGRSAADVALLRGIDLQPTGKLVSGPGGAVTVEDVYPGPYVLRATGDWNRNIRIYTSVDDDGSVKCQAEEL